MTLIFVLIGFAGLGLFLLLHFVLWQVLSPARKNTAMMTLAACAGYVTAATCAGILLQVPALAHGPVSLPLFMFLAVLYFHFYYGVDRSVSVRTLGALACAPGQSLTPNELQAVYPKEEMIHRRLGIMVEYGWILKRGGSFQCTEKGRQLARVARLGRRIYGLDATG